MGSLFKIGWNIIFSNSGNIGQPILGKLERRGGPRRETEANKLLNAVTEQPDLGASTPVHVLNQKNLATRATNSQDRSEEVLCVCVFFFPRKNKTLENLFSLRKKYRLKNLIRWGLYLETTCLPVNTDLLRKEAKNGPVQLFSGKEPITFGDLGSWAQSDSWKLKHVAKIRDIAECSILKFDPKTQFMSCWFYCREEVYSKGSFKPLTLSFACLALQSHGISNIPGRYLPFRNESNSA